LFQTKLLFQESTILLNFDLFLTPKFTDTGAQCFTLFLNNFQMQWSTTANCEHL